MSTPPKKKKYTNKELMKLAGSSSGAYDPEAPAQWRYVLTHGAPSEQCVAWVKSKTTHMSRSPYCVSERGTALWIQHMASDLDWKEQTARNVLNEVAKEGRVRIDHETKRIWYCAEFEIPERRTKSAADNSVQSYLPPYVNEYIDKLPSQRKRQYLAEFKVVLRWKKELAADAMAAIRNITEQVEDNMFRGWGADKKRLPKRPPERSRHLKLSLVAVPPIVQSYAPPQEPEFIQTAVSTLHEPEPEFVQSGAHLNLGEIKAPSDQTRQTLAASPALEIKNQKRSVGQSIEDRRTDLSEPLLSEGPNEPPLDGPGVQKLLVAELRKKLPGERPTDALGEKVAEIMRGVPIETMRAAIRRNYQKFTSYGFASHVAVEARAAWQDESAERDKKAAELKARAEKESAATLRAAREALADPHADEKDRKWAHEAIAHLEKSKGATS